MLMNDKEYLIILLLNTIFKLITLDLLIFRVQSEIFYGRVSFR